jgi:hypothetical protein
VPGQFFPLELKEEPQVRYGHGLGKNESEIQSTKFETNSNDRNSESGIRVQDSGDREQGSRKKEERKGAKNTREEPPKRFTGDILKKPIKKAKIIL